MAIPLIAPAHKKASAFVDTFQNPFGKTLSSIFDPIVAQYKAGTLTYDQAKDAFDTYNQQWTAFDEAAQQFKAMGGDYAKVVKQAYDPNGDFMKTNLMVKNTLQGYVDSLKPAETTTDSTDGAAPTMPKDANDQARKAALIQTKRAMAAPGFISTILGGALSSPKTKQRTLLGY